MNADKHRCLNIAVPLTVKGMEWYPLPETVCCMAGFLLLQNLHFHRPWWSDAASELTRTPCFYLTGQRVTGDGLQFMSRIVMPLT